MQFGTWPRHERGGRRADGRDDDLAEALVPVVRRLLQTGTGPPALSSFARACGVDLARRAVWTLHDEQTARALARRAADRLAPAAGTVVARNVETVVGSTYG
jgi:hypothetical protein